MRITVRHYFDFGDDRDIVGDELVGADAWDALRTRTRGPFELPASREDWERTADHQRDIRTRAEEINRWLDSQGATSLSSYGVGAAWLEFWLHRLCPSRSMTMTDYAPATVARLQTLLPEATVRHHDLAAEGPIPAYVHLFHRIDTEFTNRQWRLIFQRFSHKRILFIAADVMGVKRALSQVRIRVGVSTAIPAGLSRNRSAFESLWRHTHSAKRMRFSDGAHGWALKPKL